MRLTLSVLTFCSWVAMMLATWRVNSLTDRATNEFNAKAAPADRIPVFSFKWRGGPGRDRHQALYPGTDLWTKMRRAEIAAVISFLTFAIFMQALVKYWDR